MRERQAGSRSLSRFWQRAIVSRSLADWLILPLWAVLDRLLSKRRERWAFFVHPLKTDQFVENSRAVYEHVKNDPNLHKVVFCRDSNAARLRLEPGINTRLVELQSLSGLWHLARCGTYLLTNSIAMDVSWRWTEGGFSVPKASLTRRVVVNLWHGIPLKRLFALSASQEVRARADRSRYRLVERAHYSGLVCSSDVDSYAMAAIFHPLPHERMWITGLPRNDFLRMSHERLPAFLRDEVELIRHLRGSRRLVTYAPTFRDSQVQASQCYQFSEQQIEQLRQLMDKHHAVFGFRMHYFRKGDQLFNMERYIDGRLLIDLGHQVIHEIAPVLRESDVVITDYSSVYIDALYIDKPVFSFAYDLEHYRTQQNGLLYDMQLAFPGPVLSDFDQLLQAVDRELSSPQQTQSERYETAKKFFFNHRDDRNAARVVDRLHSLMEKGR